MAPAKKKPAKQKKTRSKTNPAPAPAPAPALGGSCDDGLGLAGLERAWAVMNRDLAVLLKYLEVHQQQDRSQRAAIATQATKMQQDIQNHHLALQQRIAALSAPADDCDDPPEPCDHDGDPDEHTTRALAKGIRQVVAHAVEPVRFRLGEYTLRLG